MDDDDDAAAGEGCRGEEKGEKELGRLLTNRAEYLSKKSMNYAYSFNANI